MKAYKVTVLVIDFENQGADDIKISLENMKYVHASVLSSEAADIGEWSDVHALNHNGTFDAEVARLFPTTPSSGVVRE
jgi:hypothetical protein